jgi:hypothetical protein
VVIVTPVPAESPEAPVVELERIWRITTSTGGTVHVRLLTDGQGNPRVVLEPLNWESGDGQVFDVEVARAIAQAMLEACEVAVALE